MSGRIIAVSLAIELAFPLLLLAQRPAPGTLLPPTLFVGATIHTGTGTLIHNGVLATDSKGKILFVKALSQLTPQDTAGINLQVVNVSGRHIYPGLIALNTRLGISEIDLVRATHDFKEVGELTPSVRTAIAYNTDSRVIPTVRANGILIAQVVPDGSLLAGKSSVMRLDAWNWEDAAIRTEEGVHLYWPSRRRLSYWIVEPPSVEENKKRIEKLTHLTTFFKEAKAYCLSAQKEPPNTLFESMCGLFDHSLSLYIHATAAEDILEAINWAEEMAVKSVLVTGYDAIFVKEELARRSIPVVYVEVHDLPLRTDDHLFAPFTAVAELTRAGVLVAVAMRGYWSQRNLAFSVGTAIAYTGMDREEALQLITLNPARILGIDSLYGSLEAGKSATLIITEGDIFEIKEARVLRALIDGREVDLDNHQRILYERYKKRYEQLGIYR